MMSFSEKWLPGTQQGASKSAGKRRQPPLHKTGAQESTSMWCGIEEKHLWVQGRMIYLDKDLR